WVIRNPTNFEMAIPRLAANAAKIALRLPSVTSARLDARRSHGPIWSPFSISGSPAGSVGPERVPARCGHGWKSHEMVADRPVASCPAADGAIWSLCVSKLNLVTHILNIDNVGDQIDPSPPDVAEPRR